jgi:hypothetical protein
MGHGHYCGPEPGTIKKAKKRPARTAGFSQMSQLYQALVVQEDE